jgi:Rrf2 family transcriptional regulator, iron-sulfur cluster assembly transcription factor
MCTLTDFSNHEWRPPLYSRPCERAIVVLAHLAKYPAGEGVSVKDIARKEGIPASALAKTIRRLSQEGFVRYVGGYGGGFALGVDSATIRLLAIVCAIDASACYEHCALGYATCSAEYPCAMHEGWKRIGVHIREYLETTTIADSVNRP